MMVQCSDALTYLKQSDIANHSRPLTVDQMEDSCPKFTTSMQPENVHNLTHSWDDYKKEAGLLEKESSLTGFKQLSYTEPDAHNPRVWFVDIEPYIRHNLGGFIYSKDKNEEVRRVLEKLAAERKVTITRITKTTEHDALIRKEFFPRAEPINLVLAVRPSIHAEGVGFYCTLAVFNRWVAWKRKKMRGGGVCAHCGRR
ncbi:hypothetical protein P171DRAFT_438254 [Karstenula rhodostoma CBS 690.94]|uniref:Uncharacterized protein n=1 Tax=Karstenula rhodostoma CBS 690.94 TaxID=1392251 RepID=A0A9P4PZ57_9PLEO|nr:hypothetical protein P171DRAFT_438254 [Karstenula rhodostoma CBS 690.94]